MRIKRYEAPTIQEALMKVKKDLGPEAVILYTKTFRKGGVMGLFGKPMAEITAGVDLNLLDDIAKRKNVSSNTFVTPDRSEGPALRPSTVPLPFSVGTLDPARARLKLSSESLMK